MKYYILYKPAPAGIAYAVTTEPATAARHGWIATEFPACESAADAWQTIAAYQAGAPQDPPFKQFKHYCFEDSRGPVEVHLSRIGAEIAEVTGLKPLVSPGVWKTDHGTFSNIGLARRMARIFLETPQQ